MVRKLQGISKEQDKNIGDEIDKGITANIPGLIRASFSLSSQMEDADRLISALTEIASNGPEHYVNLYQMDEVNGQWTVKQPIQAEWIMI